MGGSFNIMKKAQLGPFQNITRNNRPNKRARLPKRKPDEEGTDSLPTACTNAQHPETRVKARVSHLSPALQRRGDGLPPSVELKPMKKETQTEPSSRGRKRQTRPRKESRLGRRRTETPVRLNRDNPVEKPPSTRKTRDAEPKAGDTELRTTPHPRVKIQPFSAGEERENAGDESRSECD
ncbi:hypothetical protein IGI04_005714 [Brassica rapa subsp. trilocularis]|uniref:Uncharacterized protein n=1 Tax=Brassica rapa subsp. trilocularis TaxID=1813537 RepID=A0ABQ7NEU2_BRACM|nr:hypothetical protein IGI04_005714 [Brassica rapa subsp. trilocularis]